MQIRHLLLPPVPYGQRAHILRGQRQVSSNAKEHIRRKSIHSRFNEGFIAVGRFNKNLRLAVFENPLLQKLQFFVQLGAAGWQVAVEAEVLPVEARGHQAKQDGRRADQGHHLNASLMGRLHYKSAGVCYPRTAGLGEQADVFTLFGVFQETGAFLRGCVLGDLVERELAEGFHRIRLLNEAPGGLGAFGDENI